MTEALTQSELAHYTNLWCKSKGISSRDLTQHPQADDIILLVNFRQELWPHMTKSHQASWGAFWSYSYTWKKPLRKKHLVKLENISISAINTKKFKDIQANEQRQRIRQLRQTFTT